ncbi:hypothetical protein ACH5A3_20090 [Streptomyces echinatus]|uniref:hypothetical protein n=1 Tax=Streptomyces echinatus TaxID=67293 RepID=UPI00378B06EA
MADLTVGPYLLDREGFGPAPAGYDAGMLLAYRLLLPDVAPRVRDTFPIPARRQGAWRRSSWSPSHCSPPRAGTTANSCRHSRT